MKVRIKKLPQARTGYQVQGSLANDVPAMGGADYNTYIGKPKLKSSKYLTAVPREKANLEAEGGETAYGDLNGDGMAEHKIIKGPRHSHGGVPLNLPDDTFIYSDFRGMNIKEPEFLEMFGKTAGKKGKKTYTPAELAKQYDIEKYRKILQDPDSDYIDKKTAELMIKNYQTKLGLLAIVQESKKGLPQGVAKAFKPGMEAMGITEQGLTDPNITAFEKQIKGKIDALKEQQEQGQPENPEEQGGEEAYAEAQQMNQGQPVAQPEEMEQPMAQYGMSIGGYDFPYEEEMPEAEYGMAMGANPRNYMGRPKSPMYARGGALERFDPGGPTGTTTAATDLDVSGKSDAEIRRIEFEAKQKDPNANIRLVRKNAKGKVVPLKRRDVNDNYKTRADKYTADDFKDKKYKDTPANRIALAQIEMFKQQLDDPKFGAEYVKETQEALKDKRVFVNKRGVQGKIYKDAYGKEPTPEEIKKSALDMFTRNSMMQAQGFNARLLTDDGSQLDDPKNIVKDGVINPTSGQPYTLKEAQDAINDYRTKGWTSVNKVVNEFGLPPIPNQNTVDGRAAIALEQTTTHGYARLHDKLNSGGYDQDPDMKYTMITNLGENRKGELNTGRGDETSMKGLYKNSSVQISPSDGYYGNTSAEQKNASDPGSVAYDEEVEAENPEEKKNTETKTEDKECECKTADGATVNPGKNANGECLPCPEEEIPVDVPKEPAKFWTQDNIKTAGATADLMSINYYGPMSTSVNLENQDLEYVDPTRALSANAEQANIASKALSQIGAPQGAAANILASQGKSAAAAADIIGKYDNTNQGIGSQYATNYANIENQERTFNAGARQKLYDSTVMANQAYDNSKRAARNNLMNAYTNALTNRAKTDAMNQIYPDYQIHPDKAGEMTYKGKGRDFNPSKASDPYWEARKRCVDEGASNPDECAKNATGQSPTPQNKGEIVNQLYAKAGGFIYSDIVYPFVL